MYKRSGLQEERVRVEQERELRQNGDIEFVFDPRLTNHPGDFAPDLE